MTNPPKQQRPLCQANDNTCLNLAEIRGKKRSGEIYYGRWCDNHRRKGHNINGFRNPNSIRYLPLDKCAMCNHKATDRHRIIPGSEYTTKKVFELCKDCHKKIHRLYDELKNRGYEIVGSSQPPTTEQEIDEILFKIIPPRVVGKYDFNRPGKVIAVDTSEGLRDEAKQSLAAILDKREREARIDELEKLPRAGFVGSNGLRFHATLHSQLDNRIAQLKESQTEGSDASVRSA